MNRFTQRVKFKNNLVVNNARADILRVIDELCTKHGLGYFCIGDLLVGAVHYNDFIPDGLDSDAQVGMLREDFDKFLKLIYEHAQEYSISIIDRYKSGAKSLCFVKACFYRLGKRNCRGRRNRRGLCVRLCTRLCC